MEKDMKYTKYEKARIIGARALQISMGAPILIKMSPKKLEELRYNPIEIAKLEFDNNAIPISVKRNYPTPRVEEAAPKQKIDPKDIIDIKEEPEAPAKSKSKKKKGKKAVEEDDDDEEIK